MLTHSSSMSAEKRSKEGSNGNGFVRKDVRERKG
jgi:hypothetical protein